MKVIQAELKNYNRRADNSVSLRLDSLIELSSADIAEVDPSKASFYPEPIRIRIEGTEKYVKQLLKEREREEHGYRVTLEYVLADDIKKEIKLLKEGDDLQE